MILFPAIDLFEGKAVRLYKGDYDRMTVYSHHPEEIAADFAAVELDEAKRGRLRKVGIVGEIYIKFSPVGNRHLEDLLRQNECEYRLGGFLNYCMFVLYTDMILAKLNGSTGGGSLESASLAIK